MRLTFVNISSSNLLYHLLLFLLSPISAIPIGPYSDRLPRSTELIEMEAVAHFFIRNHGAHMNNLALARSIHAELEERFSTFYNLVGVYDLCQDEQESTRYPLIWPLNSASAVAYSVVPIVGNSSSEQSARGVTVWRNDSQRKMECSRKGYLLWASERAHRVQPQCLRTKWTSACPLMISQVEDGLSDEEFPLAAKYALLDMLHRRGCTDTPDLVSFVPYWMNLRVVASTSPYINARLLLNDCTGYQQQQWRPNRRTLAFYSLLVFSN